MQDQIFNIFDDREWTAEGKSKILAQLQECFGFLLNKFQNAGLPRVNAMPPQRTLPLSGPHAHLGDGPPDGVVETDRLQFISMGRRRRRGS